MRTPIRFRAETKYQESSAKKANTNLPIMARVGNHAAGVAAIAGRPGWYYIRIGDGTTGASPNRLTQCKAEGVGLVLNDYIYVIKARDRDLTHYKFHSFIQSTGLLPHPILFARGIIIPDNVAQGFYIEDDDSVGAGSPEYLRIDTRDGPAQVVTWNFGGADVDFVVEASGVPNALFVQGSDGHVGANTGTLLDGIFNVYAPGGTANVTAHTYSATAVHEASVHCRRARGTPGAEANVQAGDTIGSWYFQGWDLGAVWAGYARITASVDAVNQSGGRLSFAVRDAALATTERMYITMTGAITVSGPSMTVPATWNLVGADNVADMLGIDDAGGLEYMRIDSRNAQPIYHVNPGGADIDTIFSASGVPNALFVQGSDGAVSMDVTLDVAGHSAFGNAAAINVNRCVNVNETLASLLASRYAMHFYEDATLSANSAFAATGALGQARITTAGFNATSGTAVVGLQGTAYADGVGGTITGIIGLRGFARNQGTCTVTSAYVMRLRTIQNTGGGAIGTGYGLYIENQTVAGTNYAIYSAGGRSYHAGTLAVGGTNSVAAQLYVDQSAAAGAIPVALLDQADQSEEFIEFTSAIGAAMPIDTVTGLGGYYGMARVSVTGVGFKWVALYN